MSILIIETILLIILRQKHIFEMKFFLFVWIQYFKSWGSLEDKKTILPSSISLTIILPWNIISKALIKLINYFDNFLVVMDFEHGSWESFNINVGFFNFDIAIEISKVFGFHFHAFEDSNKTKDGELFVGFICVVINGELLDHFGFDSVDSFLIEFDFRVVILKLFFELSNDKDRVF